MGDVVFGIVILIVAGVLIYYGWKDAKDELNREMEEYDAFEQRREQRQAEFDRHAQEVAHRCLMEACETVHIGNWRGSYEQKD